MVCCLWQSGKPGLLLGRFGMGSTSTAYMMGFGQPVFPGYESFLQSFLLSGYPESLAECIS
jgi:hypothetical protein